MFIGSNLSCGIKLLEIVIIEKTFLNAFIYEIACAIKRCYLYTAFFLL